MSTIKLSLTRKKKYFGSMIPLRILINGQHVANIKNGESISLDVPDSRTVLKVEMVGNALTVHNVIKEAVLFTDYSSGIIECLIYSKLNWAGFITNGLFGPYARIELKITYK